MRTCMFERLIRAKRSLILTLLLCTCALQGWHTVDTCPQCGLTCQLWSTTTSSPQTGPARHPGASAKRCGASTRKTARWVQPLILQALQPNETARPSPQSDTPHLSHTMANLKPRHHSKLPSHHLVMDIDRHSKTL